MGGAPAPPCPSWVPFLQLPGPRALGVCTRVLCRMHTVALPPRGRLVSTPSRAEPLSYPFVTSPAPRTAWGVAGACEIAGELT